MSRISHAGRSDVGRQRPRNEDRWTADASLGLYLVADGVGGAGGGAVAAQFVIDTLPALVRKHMRGVRSLADARAAERIQEALSEVNLGLRRESQKHRIRAMGAAVVLSLVWESEVLVAHLGDSRAYLFQDGELWQLTQDHTALQRMLDAGEVSPTEAENHPSAGLLTRYVGLEDKVEPGICVAELGPGDRLLLCSDGLPSMVSDAEIAGILSLDVPADQICGLLVDTANLLGGHDNTTVVIVKRDAAPRSVARLS